MRIYKRSDRIPIKIGDIKLTIAPLTVDQKTEIQQAMLNGRVKGDIKEATRGVVLSIKYAVKGVEGIEGADGSPYALQFDDSKNLTDECVDDLLNVGMNKQLTMVCASLANGVPDQFTDEKGERLEGVEILKGETSPNA
jgi:hypothetical protein